MLAQALEVLLQLRMARSKVLEQSGAVGHFDQHATEMPVEGQPFRLCLNGSDGPLEFGHLVADGGHLLPGALDFTHHDLKPLKFAHGLAEGRPLKNAVVDATLRRPQ